MARDQELLRKRNIAIQKAYNHLSREKTKDGKATKYTHTYVLERLEEQFYLTANMIDKILKEDNGPEISNQGTLFENI